METYTYDDVKDHSAGDVFKLRGRHYKLLKKTSTAISVERWYWWDSAAAWLWRRIGSTRSSGYGE